MKKESIRKVLWWALGIKTLYFCLTVLAILFQGSIKPLFGISEDTIGSLFVIPIDSVMSATVSVILMLVLVVIINNGLKQAKTSIDAEIAGVVLFSGISVITSFLGNILITHSVSLINTTAVANYTAIKSYLGILEVISRVSSALFILACGMLIVYKKDFQKYNTKNQEI